MFKRRDIPPVLLLLLLIILVMLTLSQILVVHNGRYGRNVHSMRRLQLELREMDINLHSLMMQNVPSIELSRRLLQNEINTARFAQILDQAAKPEPKTRRLQAARGRRKVAVHTHNVRHEPTQPVGGAVNCDIGNGTRTGTCNHGNKNRTSRAVTSPRSHRSRDRTRHGAGRSAGQGHNLTSTLNSHLSTNQHLVLVKDNNVTNYTRNSQPDDVTNYKRNSQPDDVTKYTSNFQLDDVTKYTRNSQPDDVTANKTLRQKSVIKYCPSIPPSLKGRAFIEDVHSHNMTSTEVIEHNPEVVPGGRWRPSGCVARHKVAVVIPYRDRERHLAILLSHIHPILQRQQLDYRVYVVEQFGGDTFNKARIMNVAFVEALKQYGFHCFVFHDVDLVPEDDRNMYSCPAQPRHMSVAIDEMGYKLAYQELVGGVLNMRTEHFQRVNGYSNLYWGWGAEDDDMAYRIMHVGLKITRPPETVARYKMIQHTKRKPSDWRKRLKLLYTGTRRFQFDGLNSLQYKIVHIDDKPLFTHVLVDIGKPPKGF